MDSRMADRTVSLRRFRRGREGRSCVFCVLSEKRMRHSAWSSPEQEHSPTYLRCDNWGALWDSLARKGEGGMKLVRLRNMCILLRERDEALALGLAKSHTFCWAACVRSCLWLVWQEGSG